MIIGIFGDSFAAPVNPCGWPNLLASTYQHNVKNFAKESSSLFWSYKKLLKHIDQVDLVIFVATANGRLYYPDDSLQFISTIWSTDAVLTGQMTNDNVNVSNRPIIKAAKEYFLHLSQPDFDSYVHEQIIKSIHELCIHKNKKLILIPAFEENVRYQTIFSFSLETIMFKELEATFNDRTFILETSMRANHMCQENNIRLAKILNNLLQGNLPTVTIDDFEFKKETNPELHWVLKRN